MTKTFKEALEAIDADGVATVNDPHERDYVLNDSIDIILPVGTRLYTAEQALAAHEAVIGGDLRVLIGKRHPKGAFVSAPEPVHIHDCPYVCHGKRYGPCICGGDELSAEIEQVMAATQPSLTAEPIGGWQRVFVKFVRDNTNCTHEQAFAVLGNVIDLRESSSQRGFARGFDQAHKELSTAEPAGEVNAELLAALRACAETLARIRADYHVSTSAEIAAERAIQRAEAGQPKEAVCECGQSGCATVCDQCGGRITTKRSET